MAKKKDIPISTGDLETDPFLKGGRYPLGRLPRAFAGCFFDGKVSEIYEGEDACEKYVKRAVQFYGINYLHNGGKFDLHFLLPDVLTHFACEDLELTCIGPRMVSLKTPTVEFRDSFSLIPKPLKKLSRAEKKEIEFWKLEEFAEDLTPEQAKKFWAEIEKLSITPRTTWPSPRAFYRDEIIAYLRQDCKGLYDAVKEFTDLYGKNLTLASAAFNYNKREFECPTVHTSEDYDDLFRPFYFAGRVQFFSLGIVAKEGTTLDKEVDLTAVKWIKDEIKICDINSAFPAAMTEEHWFSSEYRVTRKPPKENKERSFYEITCDSRGALPVRTKKGIEFPTVTNGSFFATGWELFAAIECGLVSNVRFLRCYTPEGTRSFANYVRHFYELKKSAPNVSERDFAKLFLNSLYGKYSQNVRNFTEVRVTKFRQYSAQHMQTLGWAHSYDDENRGLSFYQKPTYQQDGRDKNGRPMQFYNVCTAASITGHVRAFLMRSMHACKNVLYCDTDSIMAEDISALKIGDELGQWKLEQVCDAVWIGGKKLYAARNKDKSDPKKLWKKASKGVRLTVEQICAVCEGEAQSYSFEAPNYSVFSPPRFTTRKVRRDDQRKKVA